MDFQTPSVSCRAIARLIPVQSPCLFEQHLANEFGQGPRCQGGNKILRAPVPEDALAGGETRCAWGQGKHRCRTPSWLSRPVFLRLNDCEERCAAGDYETPVSSQWGTMLLHPLEIHRERFEALEDTSILGLFKRGVGFQHQQLDLPRVTVFYSRVGHEWLRVELATMGWS